MIGEFFIISRRINKKIKSVFTDKSDKILDLGCGSNPKYHKSINGRILCFDKTESKITDVVGDANNLPFRANSFDKIISVNSFYYFDNPFKVVKDVHKILKNSGKLILIMPFIYPIHDAPHDKYRFTEFGIRELLKGYFYVKEIKTIGGIFNLPAVFLHSLLKGLPLVAPKKIRILIKVLAIIALYPFYVIAQILSLLDFLDITRRWPTYYFVVAEKR